MNEDDKDNDEFIHALSHLRLGRKYNYSPLPSDSSFRVIELLPGKFEDEVRLQLQIADWSSPPTYEAISYAWGDAKDTEICICEGEEFTITKSLHTAFQHFRHEQTSRILWADAIWYDIYSQQ
jgi:hypothetical protein